MPAKTKAQLTTEINTNLADNTSGAITPTLVRTTLIDMVDSWLDLNGATSFTAPANNFGTGFTSLSLPSSAQPAFTNLSGNIAVSQMAGGSGASASTFWRGDGVWSAVFGASLNAVPATPAATISTSGVMMGLGVTTCRITPIGPGRLNITVYGTFGNTNTGVQTLVQLRYGTGAGPANGVALTGTTLGTPVWAVLSGANWATPFSVSGIVTGLSIGTAVWIDLGVSVTAGTGSILGVGCTAMEF